MYLAIFKKIKSRDLESTCLSKNVAKRIWYAAKNCFAGLWRSRPKFDSQSRSNKQILE